MLRSSQMIQLIVVALLGLAVVMVQSAGMSVGREAGLDALVTSRHAMYALAAVVVMLLASRVNLQHFIEVRCWASPVRWVMLIALGLVAMTMVPGLGRTVNGATRWLDIPGLGISFQPSELVKWALVLALASWCTRRRGVMHQFWLGLVPPLLLLGLACGMVVLEDLGTAVLMGSVGVLLLFAGGARLWQLALMAPPALVAVGLAVASSEYRRARLTAFLDPWADPQGTGYHPIQSMLAFAQGGLFGRGLGNGIQKFGYLPEDTTDFLFAIIAEELGIAGVVLVIGLYLALLWVGFGIVRRSRLLFPQLVALGVLATVGLQALINLAVVTVLVPTKGIALPLLSAGGTGWVLAALMLGLVASVGEVNECPVEDELIEVPAGRVSRAAAEPTAEPAS